MEEEEELMLDRLEVLLIIIPIKLHLLPILRLWGGDNCQCVRDALLDQNTCFFIKFIKEGGRVKPVYENFAANLVRYEKSEKKQKNKKT